MLSSPGFWGRKREPVRAECLRHPDQRRYPTARVVNRRYRASRADAMLEASQEDFDMDKRIIGFFVATAVATAPLSSYALGTNEKGCLVGGAGGALAGNLIGGSSKGTLIGGALGCGVGIYANKQRVNK